MRHALASLAATSSPAPACAVHAGGSRSRSASISRNCCCCSCSPQPSTSAATGSAPDRRASSRCSVPAPSSIRARCCCSAAALLALIFAAARAGAGDAGDRASRRCRSRRRCISSCRCSYGDSLAMGLTFELVRRLFVLWMVVILVRSVAVALAPPHARCGCARSAAACCWRADLVSNALAPNEPWWRGAGGRRGGVGGPVGGFRGRARDADFSARSHASELADERPGVTDLYFVGFAPYGAAGCLPQGRRGRAARDGSALGHGRALGAARQQSANAAHDAVRDDHQPARDAERDRRRDRRRGRCGDGLSREPRHAAISA